MKLLVVEDDINTSESVCEYFCEKGFEVIPAYDGEEALRLFGEEGIDLVLLDVMLPKVTGLAVLHELRKVSHVPIIMLTAIGDEFTQITSFDQMADDYVTKPFSIVVLHKRVEALLRRGRYKELPNLWSYKDITVDFNGYTAKGSSGEIDITPREIMLLRLFVERQGRVLSRTFILDELWGEDKPVFDRTVDSHIKNLRRKLGLNCIITVTGVGYKLEVDQ